MTKKMIILNASPRKNRNTATLLKEVQRGAEAADAEVEYIDLVSMTFKGCMSCMACKRTGNKCGGLCAFKDDLRPVLEKILAADALVIGSPIYYAYPTGMFRNLLERLFFPILNYNSDGKGGVLKNLDKKMNVAIVYTMNCTKEQAEMFNYPAILAPNSNYMEYYFGYCEVLNSYNTWQFYPDYSKFDSSAVDVSLKEWFRDNQWPKDMEAAFEMGKRLVE